MKRRRKKNKLPKPRNPYVIPAKNRKAGAHKNKINKRAKENHNPDYTKEEY